MSNLPPRGGRLRGGSRRRRPVADALDELIGDLTERAEGLGASGVDDEAQLLTELAVPWPRKETALRRAAAAQRQFLAARAPVRRPGGS